MADVKSISVREITAAAKSSGSKLLASTKAIGTGGGRMGYIARHHWIGLIMREEAGKLDQAKTLAAEIQQSVGGNVAALKGGTPGVILSGGQIIVGFMPPRDIDIIAE